MSLIAGTTRGAFRIADGNVEPVLDQRGVRELTAVGERLFAGTSAGLFASSDDGRTWTNAGIDATVWQVRAGPSADVLYASTEPAGLFCSRDGGNAWLEVESFSRVPEAASWCVPVEPRQPGRARALVVDQSNPRQLWVGVEVGGIMHTSDAGKSWQIGLPGGNPDIHMLCAHPARPHVLFATTGYGRFDGAAPMIEGNAGVFRSDDGGASWRYVWEGITPRYSRPMCVDQRAPYALTVASAPTAFSSFRDEGGAKAVLLRSDDGGDSWRSLGDADHSPSSSNFHGLAVHPSEPGAVVVGTDTGEVWRVTARGQWTQEASGMPTVLSLIAL